MANYYTTFSCELTDLTEKEMRWANRVLISREYRNDERGDGISFPEWQVDKKRGELWLYSDYGAVETTAEFVQRFIQKLRPGHIFAFEWANTCSRPIINSFGGGACVVTEDEIYWNSTSCWVSEKNKELSGGDYDKVL